MRQLLPTNNRVAVAYAAKIAEKVEGALYRISWRFNYKRNCQRMKGGRLLLICKHKSKCRELTTRTFRLRRLTWCYRVACYYRCSYRRHWCHNNDEIRILHWIGVSSEESMRRECWVKRGQKPTLMLIWTCTSAAFYLSSPKTAKASSCSTRLFILNATMMIVFAQASEGMHHAFG